MSFGHILYYDGYGSYDFPEKSRLKKPLKEIEKINKKNASSENLTMKKMNTGPSLYYDEFGSYDFPKMKSWLMQMQISALILILKLIKYLKNQI